MQPTARADNSDHIILIKLHYEELTSDFIRLNKNGSKSECKVAADSLSSKGQYKVNIYHTLCTL